MEKTSIQRVYSNPSVREAIFSIAFKKSVDLAQIQAFCTEGLISEKYPVHASLSDNKSDETIQDALGYILRSSDSLTTLRLTTTQFSYHNFNKYLGWDANKESFLDAWKVLQHYCGNDNVRYATIRYINDIKIGEMPSGGIDISKYLNLLPDVPDDFPGERGRFFVQLQTYDTETNLEIRVWSTFIPPKEDNSTFAILLDISVRNDPSEESDLELFMTKSRSLKNQVFESCITDATRALLN